jgi:hypothetical protein
MTTLLKNCAVIHTSVFVSCVTESVLMTIVSIIPRIRKTQKLFETYHPFSRHIYGNDDLFVNDFFHKKKPQNKVTLKVTKFHALNLTIAKKLSNHITYPLRT